MQNIPRSEDPTPAVQLDYYEQHGGSWSTVIRWAAWAAMAYSAITVTASIPTIVYYLMQSMPGSPRISVASSTQMTLFLIPTMASSGLLLAGAITMLRRPKIGRSMLLWACAALIVCGVVQTIYSMYLYPAQRSPRSLGASFVVYLYASQFFSMLHGAFVPTIFILLFCRREVKEACGN